jgi:hypothetical protein
MDSERSQGGERDGNRGKGEAAQRGFCLEQVSAIARAVVDSQQGHYAEKVHQLEP